MSSWYDLADERKMWYGWLVALLLYCYTCSMVVTTPLMHVVIVLLAGGPNTSEVSNYLFFYLMNKHTVGCPYPCPWPLFLSAAMCN